MTGSIRRFRAGKSCWSAASVKRDSGQIGSRSDGALLSCNIKANTGGVVAVRVRSGEDEISENTCNRVLFHSLHCAIRLDQRAENESPATCSIVGEEDSQQGKDY